MSEPIKTASAFNIEVSPDRMTATVVVGEGAKVSATEIIVALREMKLVGFDDDAIIEAMENRKTEAISVVVARGMAAVNERPKRVEYRVPVADEVSGSVVKVEAGQIVGTFSAAIPGTDGVDVYGQPVAPKPGESCKIGRNLSVSKDEIIATSGGNLRLSGNSLSVEPLMELRDDNNTAAVNFDGDVHVKGCLSEGRVMELTGSLTVGGAIEAVDLKAGGSVNVKGGIIGKSKGKYVIGGDLRCRFISGGTIIAGATIHVQSEVSNSQIVCAGRLVVLHGPIAGGDVAANGGIACKVLGHPNGTPTVVEAGSRQVLESLVGATQRQIEANHKRISTVRAKIEPLMCQQKHLTAQQKEKATELLFEAGELEEKTIAMSKGLEDQARVMKENECAEIIVEEVAHPGVIVRLAGHETVISAAFKGPFKLELRKLAGLTHIVLVDGVDQSINTLPSHYLFEEHSQAAAAGVSPKAA